MGPLYNTPLFIGTAAQRPTRNADLPYPYHSARRRPLGFCKNIYIFSFCFFNILTVRRGFSGHDEDQRVPRRDPLGVPRQSRHVPREDPTVAAAILRFETGGHNEIPVRHKVPLSGRGGQETEKNKRYRYVTICI